LRRGRIAAVVSVHQDEGVPSMASKSGGLKTGHFYPFVGLQIDIAGHSKLGDAERVLHEAKERFHRQIAGIVETYGGESLGWKGDGGAFLFAVTDGKEYDEAVLAGFRILESLPGVNGELKITTGLSEALEVRISLDAGQAVYDKNPGLITGDFLNAFLKHERSLGRVGTVSITERVHRQLGGPLRGRFAEVGHSEELGCKVYRSAGAGPGATRDLVSAAQGPPPSVTPTPGSPAGQVSSSPAQGLSPMDRGKLVRDLAGLSPSDFAFLVTMIPGAAAHVSRHGAVPELVADLIRWAESPTGPERKLGAVAEAYEAIRNPR
jgi:hypothetical protein